MKLRHKQRTARRWTNWWNTASLERSQGQHLVIHWRQRRKMMMLMINEQIERNEGRGSLRRTPHGWDAEPSTVWCKYLIDDHLISTYMYTYWDGKRNPLGQRCVNALELLWLFIDENKIGSSSVEFPLWLCRYSTLFCSLFQLMLSDGTPSMYLFVYLSKREHQIVEI